MGFEFSNLDARTRELMLAEIERDSEAGTLYISKRLTKAGELAYPDLLRDAARSGNEDSFADALRAGDYFEATEPRNTSSGVTMVKVPATAAQTLAESEFNRFYVRAVCARSLEEGKGEVEVYRAKQVSSARSESQRKIGTRVPAEKLLADLRTHIGMDTVLGLPSGPNSGLSVKLVD